MTWEIVDPAWDVCCTGCEFDTHGYVECVEGNIYMARLCLLGRPGMESMMQRNEEYVDMQTLITTCTGSEILA